MKRRLVAALACRNQGSRLYGKPLQSLDIKNGTRILDNIVDCLSTVAAIDEIVLGISEGVDNEVFRDIARQRGLRYIVGDQVDVLSRLIACGDLAEATDIFRVTTESPFPYFEPVDDLWQRHQEEQADATFISNIIDGPNFELLTLESLKTSHARGSAKHRSELCSLYIREHQAEFRIIKVAAPAELDRKDIRLTVDYPEDLVVCRSVYGALQADAPRIRVAEIVRYLDRQPRLLELLAPYTAADVRKKGEVASIALVGNSAGTRHG